MKRTLLLLVLACFAASCATTGDVESLQQKLRQQEMRNRQLEGQLNQSTASLQDEIQRQNNPVRSTQANLNAEFEQLRVRVGALEGQMEDMRLGFKDKSGEAQKLSDLNGQVQAIRAALQQQLGLDVSAFQGAAPAAGADMGAPAVQAPGQAGQPVQPAQPVQSADPAQALYDQAVQSFRDGKYKDSLASLDDFVKAYPKHALLPNAIFWQGEDYYQLKDYQRAVLSYQEILDKHPKSDKYPAALLKQGMSFQRLDKPKLAKLRFQEIVDKYPKSPQASMAGAELKKLK